MKIIDKDGLLKELTLLKHEEFADDKRKIRAINKVIEIVENYPHIEKRVNNDLVEVVRCKDCKYCRPVKDGGSECERVDGLLMTTPSDYCSYGERRDDGT